MITLATLAALALALDPGAGALCTPDLSEDPEPPEYYAFPLVTTKNVPGTGLTTGTAHTSFPRSPFGVAVATDGSYVLEVRLTFERLPEPPHGRYVAWATTPDLDRIERLGEVEPGTAFTGRVAWNKFLIVVTMEEDEDPQAARWSGPIVTRGMSRSGMMHTMAGHGPFQQENCAAYGYD